MSDQTEHPHESFQDRLYDDQIDDDLAEVERWPLAVGIGVVVALGVVAAIVFGPAKCRRCRLRG